VLVYVYSVITTLSVQETPLALMEFVYTLTKKVVVATTPESLLVLEAPVLTILFVVLVLVVRSAKIIADVPLLALTVSMADACVRRNPE
jgi:hypothetical protein